MQTSIGFRPIDQTDEAFLFRVFVSTRPDVAAANLGEPEKQQFLEMQFYAQHTHYQQQHPDADFLIVLNGKKPIGRVYVHHAADEIHVIEIALLPEYRCKGIGTQLMTGILAKGRRETKPVRIHVNKMDHRAIEFYRRLGFVKIDEVPTHDLMECPP